MEPSVGPGPTQATLVVPNAKFERHGRQSRYYSCVQSSVMEMCWYPVHP